MSKRLTIEEFIKTLKSGGEGGEEPLICGIRRKDPDNVSLYELDKTWQEIHDAFLEGRVCIANVDAEGIHKGLNAITSVNSSQDAGSYGTPLVYLNIDGYGQKWECDSPDGYPSHDYND